MLRLSTTLLICSFVFAFAARGQDTSFVMAKGYTVYHGDTINTVKRGIKQGKWIFFHVDSTVGRIMSIDCYIDKNGKRFSKHKDSAWVSYRIAPCIIGYFDKGLKTGEWMFSTDSFKRVGTKALFDHDTLVNYIWLCYNVANCYVRAYKEAEGWVWIDARSDAWKSKRHSTLLEMLGRLDYTHDWVNYPYALELIDIFK